MAMEKPISQLIWRYHLPNWVGGHCLSMLICVRPVSMKFFAYPTQRVCRMFCLAVLKLKLFRLSRA
ncbi:hypothetical protein AT984_13655 [Paucibacter sp. KCTC 42545]|nr:hypothetical protein AT984_13655 [Paucibacter sp. KCTC 42545]